MDLAVALNFTDPVLNETLNYTVQLDETPNEAFPCVYGNEKAAAGATTG